MAPTIFEVIFWIASTIGSVWYTLSLIRQYNIYEIDHIFGRC